MPKTTQLKEKKLYISTNKETSKELLAEKLAYLLDIVLCSEPLANLKKLEEDI